MDHNESDHFDDVLDFGWDIDEIREHLSEIQPDAGLAYLEALRAKISEEIDMDPNDPDPRKTRRELRALSGSFERYLQVKTNKPTFARWYVMERKPSPPRTETQRAQAQRVRDSLNTLMHGPSDATVYQTGTTPATPEPKRIRWLGTNPELLLLFAVLHEAGLIEDDDWSHVSAHIVRHFAQGSGRNYSRKALNNIKSEKYDMWRLKNAADFDERLADGIDKVKNRAAIPRW